MDEVAFIAFSDIQIEDWKRYSTDHRRFHLNKGVLWKVYTLCRRYNCPALFGGDLFDNARALDNYTLNYVFNWFNLFREAGITIYAISGNHDQSESNYRDKQSPSYIQMMASIYPNFINLDFQTIPFANGIEISGIPYITGNVDYKKIVQEIRGRFTPGKKHLLMIHTDLWGAKDSYGRTVDSVTNIPATLGKFFEGFDLVLCGHIHKPQVLRDNILMMGATHQQRVSDMGTNMRIWKITKYLRYKPIFTKQPVFRYDDGKPDDYNFILPRPEVVIEQDDPVVTSFKSTDPIKLAKSFLKAKKIKSKPKLNLLIKYLKNASDQSV